MHKQIISVDLSEIQEGKLERLKSAIQELVHFVQANEARILSYNMYIDEETYHMTVVQVHPDSASMENHMEIAGPIFAKFANLISLKTMDIYGHPSEKLVEQVRKKVQMLGTASVSVHEPRAGFIRPAPPVGSNSPI
jgi:quinol monooxygenase YgiN